MGINTYKCDVDFILKMTIFEPIMEKKVLICIYFMASVFALAMLLYAPKSYHISPAKMSTTATVAISGDMMQHLPQVTAARDENGVYDYRENFRYIEPLWREADFAIVNFETTVSADGNYSGYPRFSSPASIVKSLHESGVTLCALANNHCCDRNAEGIEATIATMDSIGVRHTGVYADTLSSRKITMLNKGHLRIALLNYTYGTNGIAPPNGCVVNLIDSTQMLDDIARARQEYIASHVVVFLHWGEEYERRGNKHQQKLAMWLREKGADVVVGSHPHVVQQIDTANRVVYSLGNLISNQQAEYTDSGITVLLTFEIGKAPTIDYTPHWCDKFAPTRQERYRILTPKDSVVIQSPYVLSRFRKAIKQAREAAGI